MDIVTQAEKVKLEARLRELFDNRPMLSQRIADARALGDLKENGEYHAAREQQGLEEAEIRRLEERLARAHVVSDESKAADVVFIGSTVKLKELTRGSIEVFRLVGESSGEGAGDDADVIEVTVTSPMGEALLKARVGETVRVNAPRGVKRFEVMAIL
jgi:transcription elongation factor GreA